MTSGCGNNNGGSDSEEPVSNVEGVRLPPVELQWLISDASPEQAAALADGVLTFQEYEAAVLATVQCFREKGLSLYQEPALDALRNYAYSVFLPNEGIQEAERSMKDCEREHFNAVAMAWASYKAPNEAEILQQARDALGECIRARGQDAPEHPGVGELSSLIENVPDIYIPCVKQAQEQFNLPLFGG
jgi:hypothetical protein